MNLKICNPTDFKVALYMRLSKEDESESESESITNQRSILRSFVDENRLDVYDEYIDDGFSGTNFDRINFQRMIADIEDGKVNMVVTKDLSRLGRDYIGIGEYTERYFPEHKVRYISILDGIDTGIDSVNNDITPFRAIMNDMYAKDISKKITSVKRDKQRKGLFIGGKAVYGYKLSRTEKNTLIIDEDAAVIVRQIFNHALNGMSGREIAVMLNDNHIPPPAVYANLTTNVKRKGPYSGLWSAERVSDMLQNPTYIGHMTQGKTKKVSYKSKKSIKQKREDWIIVENTHEPLISIDVFERVQELIKSRRKTRKRKYDYTLKGIVRCYECGYPLAVINRPNAKGEDVLYFICRTYQRFTKQGVCTPHAIQAKKVINAVSEQILNVCQAYLDEQELMKTGKSVISRLEKKQEISSEINSLNSKIANITSNMDKIYLDKLDDLLDETDFTRLYNRLKDERSVLEKRLQQLNEMDKKSPKEQDEHLKKLIADFMNAETLTQELAISLIEKVELTSDKDVIITFKCEL